MWILFRYAPVLICNSINKKYCCLVKGKKKGRKGKEKQVSVVLFVVYVDI
jgi:hypothetical protein